MDLPNTKSEAQSVVALCSVIGLTLVTAASLVADRANGTSSEVTTMLAGGLISLCSTGASWLFRNENGKHTPTKPEA
jgi:hypothetical protein